MNKFGIFALPNFQYFPKISQMIDLGHGVSVLAGPLKGSLSSASLQHWESWIGSINWKSVGSRKVFLQIHRSSSETSPLDRENIELSNILHDAYLSLMICGPVRPVEGIPTMMTGLGTLQNGLINATNLQNLSSYNPWIQSNYMWKKTYHEKAPPYLQSPQLIDDWKIIFSQLRKFRKKKKGNEAILLAVESLKNGLESHYLDFRLPLFVRTSEAVMAPKKNETKAKFVSRSEYLLRQSPKPLVSLSKKRLNILLQDLFEVRNGCVHGMPFGWKIGRKAKNQNRLEQFDILSEEIARRSIRFALKTKGLLSASKNRTKLEEWCSINW